jgi:hypothetical protein
MHAIETREHYTLVEDYRVADSGVIHYQHLNGTSGSISPGAWGHVFEPNDAHLESLREDGRLDFRSVESLRVGDEYDG